MRTRSRSRHKIAEPLRIEFHSQEDQFQEDPPEVPMADNRTMVQLLQAPIVGYEDAIVIPEIAATNFELKHGLINLEDPPEVSMADNRTMAQLLQAPTEGYEDAIVIPEIVATNFELKHGLINLVQNKQFFGHEDPNVPNSTIKLMLFPFSLEGAARIWLEKEPPRSILTWDDLVSKFINQACPHHGFSELHQLDTFYNALNVNDQDSMNSAAVVAKVNSSSSTPAISSDVAELKDMVRALLLDKKNQSSAPAPSPTPAPVKAVEPNCVTCGVEPNRVTYGGTHSYQNCPATGGNVYQDNIHKYVSQAAAANYSQGNTGFRPQMVANQIRPPGFPPVQNNQNNFNRGNNFNQNRGGNFNQSNFNQGQLHQPQVNQLPAYQAPAYQAPAYQAPIPQTQSVSKTDFESYVKANDAVLRNIQSQGQRSGTLPGNTITNPKEDLKGITTRSGVAYQGPTILVPSKVVKQGTEVTKDQVQTPSSQSTTPVQPPVAQSETPVSEPVVAP
nr:hypothetical protein [Tanacetum cinerariifolium]